MGVTPAMGGGVESAEPGLFKLFLRESLDRGLCPAGLRIALRIAVRIAPPNHRLSTAAPRVATIAP